MVNTVFLEIAILNLGIQANDQIVQQDKFVINIKLFRNNVKLE